MKILVLSWIYLLLWIISYERYKNMVSVNIYILISISFIWFINYSILQARFHCYLHFILWTLFCSYYAVLAGFFIGLLVDLTPMASYFGISPLTYSITGYLSGHLQNKYNRLSPFIFHSIWIIIIAFHFIIFTYIKYQLLFEIDKLQFIFRWFSSFIYTLFFLLIMQYFFPIRRIQNA